MDDSEHSTVAWLYTCVECRTVFSVRRSRCLVCGRGPESPQPTMVPIQIHAGTVQILDRESGPSH